MIRDVCRGTSAWYRSQRVGKPTISVKFADFFREQLDSSPASGTIAKSRTYVFPIVNGGRLLESAL